MSKHIIERFRLYVNKYCSGCKSIQPYDKEDLCKQCGTPEHAVPPKAMQERIAKALKEGKVIQQKNVAAVVE